MVKSVPKRTQLGQSEHTDNPFVARIKARGEIIDGRDPKLKIYLYRVMEKHSWTLKAYRNYRLVTWQKRFPDHYKGGCQGVLLYLPLVPVFLYGFFGCLHYWNTRGDIKVLKEHEEGTYKERTDHANIPLGMKEYAGTTVSLKPVEGEPFKATTGGTGEATVPWIRRLVLNDASGVSSLRVCRGWKCTTLEVDKAGYSRVRTAFLKRPRPTLEVATRPQGSVLMKQLGVIRVVVKNTGLGLARQVKLHARLSDSGQKFWVPTKELIAVGDLRAGESKVVSLDVRKHQSLYATPGPHMLVKLGATDLLWTRTPDFQRSVSLDDKGRVFGKWRSSMIPQTLVSGKEMSSSIHSGEGRVMRKFTLACTGYQSAKVELKSDPGTSVFLRIAGVPSERVTIGADGRTGTFRCQKGENAEIGVFTNVASKTAFTLEAKLKRYRTGGRVRWRDGGYVIDKGTSSLAFNGRTGFLYYKGFKVARFRITDAETTSAVIKITRRYTRRKRPQRFRLR